MDPQREDAPAPAGGGLPVLICAEGLVPYEVGGIQRHSRLLVESLARTNELDLTVVHPEYGEPPFPDFPAVRSIGLPPRPRQGMYLREVHAWSKGVLAVAREHPDHVVYSQGLAVWSGAAELGHRLIVNPHGLEAFQAIGLRHRLISIPFRTVFNRLFRCAARVVSLGGRLTPILEARARGTVVTIPNGVDVPAEVPAKGDSPTRFLFVGRFARNKGIDILLEAAHRLARDGHEADVRFDLVGDGPLRARLEQRFALPNVTFHGKVPDETLWALYEQSHALVLPTLFEGMPTVILEAMARGTIAITTDVGATRELVNEQTGMLVRKRDVDDLVGAMRRFVETDADAKRTLSAAAREHVLQGFTWDRIARAHVDLFKGLRAATPAGQAHAP